MVSGKVHGRGEKVPQNSAKPIIPIDTRDEVAKRAKRNQGTRTDLLQNSAKSTPPIDTREEVAKKANVNHDTVVKVKYIAERVDEDTKEKLRRGDTSIHAEYKAIKKEEKQKEKAATRAAKASAAKKEITDDYNILHGDFRELAKGIADESVDLIFTDPPYDRKAMPMYGELAEIAARILRPGGSLLAYAGHYLMPDLIPAISKSLRFWWCCGVRHTSQATRMREYGIVVRWKPILWFVRGTRGDKETFLDDLIDGVKEKDSHHWQQGECEAAYYIEGLTDPTDLVFDPFCGGGTTAAAAKRTGRRWLTCDINADSVAIARKRVAAAPCDNRLADFCVC